MKFYSDDPPNWEEEYRHLEKILKSTEAALERAIEQRNYFMCQISWARGEDGRRERIERENAELLLIQSGGI